MDKAAEFVCLYGETCVNPHYARGLCRNHYNKVRNDGSLEEIGLPRKYSKPQHTLSNKNFEEKTATCAVCGVVPMSYQPSRNKWRCTVKNETYRTHFWFSKGEGNIPAKEVTEARHRLQKEQSGICAICNLRPATHLDHCHTYGTIRGLLCTQCNIGLGMFKDDIPTLILAIEYLEKNNLLR